MCCALSRLASSIKGCLSRSASSFQRVPSRRLISELCIFGFSWAIFRRWPLDQTMKAFMGRLTCDSRDDWLLVVDDWLLGPPVGVWPSAWGAICCALGPLAAPFARWLPAAAAAAAAAARCCW